MIRENEILIAVIRDSLFFLFVNRARDSPCTTLIDGKVCICFLAVAFGPSDSVSVDCKTVRIFAYSSTYARAVKQKVWNEAKNESETGERPYGRVKLTCEARALCARKTVTLRFTDFCTGFSSAYNTSSVKDF